MRKYQSCRYERTISYVISILFCLFSSEYAVGQEQSSRGFCETYTVNPGDSALSIAQNFGLDYENFVGALTECVGYVEGNVLQIGQKVCLPPYSRNCEFVTSVGEAGTCKYYTVQYGDTLATIASNFNMEVIDFASLNGFNLTDTVKPLMKLALPSWDESCPADILSKPVPEAPSSDCRVYISNGGETLAGIASKVSLKESDLSYYNVEYQTGQLTEPGAQIKLNVWSDSCRDDFIVINRPVQQESAEIPTEANSPQVSVGSGLTLAPEPSQEESFTADQFDELGRVVVDLYLKGTNSKDFSESEYLFRENLAQATNVPVSHVDVRFTLVVENLHSRKLLSENLLQVNTAIYGDELVIFQNLNQSVESGDLLQTMTEDNFNIVSVAVMQPKQAVLYDARSEEVKPTEEGSSLPLPLGALVGIAAGVAVILIILVVFCCARSSQKRKRAIEAAKEEKVTKKRMDQSSSRLSEKAVPISGVEFNLQAFSSTPESQSTIFVPIIRDTPTKEHTFNNFSGEQVVDRLPSRTSVGHNVGLDVSPRTFVSTRRYTDDTNIPVRKHESCSSENGIKPGANRAYSTKRAGQQSPKKFNKQNLSKYIEC